MNTLPKCTLGLLACPAADSARKNTRPDDIALKKMTRGRKRKSWVCKKVRLHVYALFTRCQDFLFRVSAAGHAGGPRAHYAKGAILGPGWAPWRVLWASKAARAGPLRRDYVPRRRATQDQGKPNISAFRSAAAVTSPSLTLSTLRWPRYSSSRTSSSSPCGGHGQQCLRV